MSQSLLTRSARISKKINFRAKLFVSVPAVIFLLVAFQRPASADTIYTYIGDDFNFFQQPENAGVPNPFTSEDHLFVSFTIAGPPLVCLTSCSISATDLCLGVQGPNGAHGCGFNIIGSLQTDSSGRIVAWDFSGCNVPPGDFGCEDESIFTGFTFGTGTEFIEVGNFIAGSNFPGT